MDEANTEAKDASHHPFVGLERPVDPILRVVDLPLKERQDEPRLWAERAGRRQLLQAAGQGGPGAQHLLHLLLGLLHCRVANRHFEASVDEQVGARTQSLDPFEFLEHSRIWA
eukprot:6189092-Pleurochrysis_carterae.AAC.2